jgi:hypothetical protein
VRAHRREHEVFEHAQVREQLERLEHESDLAEQRRGIAAAHDPRALDLDRARVESVEPQAQRRSVDLPAPLRPRIATSAPAGASSERSRSVGAAAPGGSW